MKLMKPYLSKSQFLRGHQCGKSLWLLRNRPELAAPADASLLNAFETGSEVGRVAHALFPGGVEVTYDANLNRMIGATKGFIKSGFDTVYEGAFRHDNVLVLADILHEGPGGWEVYEVKSSTEVKDINLYDLSVQYYVLKGAGLDVAKACLVLIDSSYVRSGPLDAVSLFKTVDLTDRVRDIQGRVVEELKTMRSTLEGGYPDIDIGPWCTDPYICDFIPHCWAHIPENSVFDLRGRGIDKFESYGRGVVSFEDLDPAVLNEAQRMQVTAELTGAVTLDREAIRGFLSTIHYPLCFLDFETLRLAIPPFDGTSPYERIPFQYSLHCMESEGAEPVHHEFLAREGTDGREELVKGLVGLVPEGACVVVYNMSFEKSVLDCLARGSPACAKELARVSEGIVDLMVPFKNRHYYTREMRGSYSLKSVLPALLPGLDYRGLEISNGEEASIVFSTLHLNPDREVVERIRGELLEYCAFDTMALLELVKKLKELEKTF